MATSDRSDYLKRIWLAAAIAVSLGLISASACLAQGSSMQPPTLELDLEVPPRATWVGNEVEFRVVYQDPDGDPPKWVMFKYENLQMEEVGLQSEQMRAVRGTEQIPPEEYQKGAVYHCVIELPKGEYQYFFEAMDRGNEMVTRLPEEGADPEYRRFSVVDLIDKIIMLVALIVASGFVAWLLGYIFWKLGVRVTAVPQLRIIFFFLFSIAAANYVFRHFALEYLLIGSGIGLVIMIVVLLSQSGGGRPRRTQPQEGDGDDGGIEL